MCISIALVWTVFVVEQQRDLLWWTVFVDICCITAFPENRKRSVVQLLIFCRCTNVARPAQYTSSRLVIDTTSSACTKVITESMGTLMPAPRNTRANETAISSADEPAGCFSAVDMADVL